MAKKSMTPSERREAILKVLCQRRQDKIDNLAFEFGVSVRTIKNDIEELSPAYPIETVRGRYGGGVKVADGYYVGRNYLSLLFPMVMPRALTIRMMDSRLAFLFAFSMWLM